MTSTYVCIITIQICVFKKLIYWLGYGSGYVSGGDINDTGPAGASGIWLKLGPAARGADDGHIFAPLTLCV